MLNVNLTDENPEDELFRAFGDRYITDAVRVVATKFSTPDDQEMIYEALCIIVSMYMQKVQDGKIAQRVVH